MKKLVICLLLLSGCGLSASNVKEFIPGTYVRDFQQQYSSGSDTLIINLADEVTGRYNIGRHLGYVSVRDGKALDAKKEKQMWVALYNADTKQLVIQRTGRLVSFSPEKQSLAIGNSVYNKIK